MPDSNPLAGESWLRNRETRENVSHENAEICVNCWYFFDETGTVIRLAAKAYALTGTDDEKLALLRQLAKADHLTAIHAKVAPRFVLNVDGKEYRGVIPANAVQADPLPVFEELFEQIAQRLPLQYRSVDGEYEAFCPELKEPFLFVSTSVYETPDGQLLARVS